MEITKKLTKDALQISIPFELIRHIAETDQDGQYIVYNVRKLADYIGEYVVDSETEEGLKQQILESITQAYEDDNEFIKSRLDEDK